MNTTNYLIWQNKRNRYRWSTPWRDSDGSVKTGAIAAGLVLALLLVLALGFSATARAEEEEGEFDEAHIFFELNNTDGDLGIHALIDGDAWKRMNIRDPNGRRMLNVYVRGRLRRQGLTEIFFESAEPTFDELSPGTFFARFPEGEYEIKGFTLDRERLESTTDLSHLMPAPPNTSVNGETQANQCDDEESGYDAPEVATPVTISWDAVSMSHPDANGGGAGVQPPEPIVVHNYEVVVEAELEISGEEFVSVMHIVVPPDITSVSIPDEFIGQTDEWKYEVLVREEGYNQTATESCFEIE